MTATSTRPVASESGTTAAAPPRSVLVIGATSAIATATARRFAADGARFMLVARSAEHLAAVGDDLRVRGAAGVETYPLDLTDIDGQAGMLAAAARALGRIDVALVAYGTLGDQHASEVSVETTLREWNTNATSTIALLTLLGNQFERQGSGTLVVLSSVAGDRGRRSNYVYGAAKAALSTFLSGLRARLSASGVRVITVKPGMVDTPMTAHLRKGPLFATPERVARDIHHAVLHGSDVVYTPRYWRYVMLLIRAMPERIFKRMKF
ncbi:MAG TPA: SDR family oxidoreductase [Thermomicrobiaceae bacterium]|nr:SDR family oxidoreductase [Thermomicrobiaceae bacterium]